MGVPCPGELKRYTPTAATSATTITTPSNSRAIFDAQNSPTFGIRPIITLPFADCALAPGANELLYRRPPERFDASTKRPVLSVMGSISYPGFFGPYGRATEIL
jgi:hypothetical protein